MTKHRAPREIRRRGRVSVLALALGVTIAVGGAAVGVLPQLKADRASADAGAVVADVSARSSLEAVTFDQLDRPTPEVADLKAAVDDAVATRDVDPGLPADSGQGRRIVFDQTDQRVWLVGDDGSVERTYLVSGSRFDNLDPGSYTVQSKTLHATAFDASGTMDYFVRFATGYSEPIGFHSVPRDHDGRLEQTKAQLGTPRSAGCVRQWKPDAVALWDFAPVGTPVTVTA